MNKELQEELKQQLESEKERYLKTLEELKESDPFLTDDRQYRNAPEDDATEVEEHDRVDALVYEAKNTLSEIDHALIKFGTGAYGQCEGTGEPIDPERLKTIPWARYSVAYEKKLEQSRS